MREQQLEERIWSLELQLQQRHETASPSASTASTGASSRSIKKLDFETIMAQQMQMIAELAASNKTNTTRMEQQMALITNLQQTVADLVIRVSDRNSNASTITSTDQRKRRIPQKLSKSSMRRIHPSDAGTTSPTNVPPDPGDTHRYRDSPTQEHQDDDTTMHNDAAPNNSHTQEEALLDDEPMVQGMDPVAPAPN